MWKIILAIVAVIVLAGIILVSVADAAAPGDLLYGIDRGVESLRLSITSNPQSLKQLQKEYTQERRDEIQALVQRGDAAQVEQALQALNQEMASTAPKDKAKDKTDNNKKANGPKDNAQNNAGENEGEDEPKEPNEGAYCDGTAEKNHPSGEKLAEQYSVSYTEIMGWFCRGYGFGEIDLAYSISAQAGKPVSEIFALRAGGMGWGEIMQQYDVKGKSDKNKDKDKPDKKNK